MKKLFFFFPLLIASLFLGGCSISGKPDGGIYKSIDGGAIFSQKNKINEKSNLGQTNIVSMAIDYHNPEILYIGTEKSGLFRTINGGENWVRDTNNFLNVNSIKIDPRNSETIYISAKIGNRGKIMKTQNGGAEWQEIYTEKTDGTSILDLAINYNDPNIIYCSNSSGGIFKSEDGGKSWSTLLWSDSPIKKIIFDKINPELIYFGSSSKGVIKSVNGGKDFEQIANNGKVYALLSHPNKEGVIYLSDSKGVHRSDNFGKDWETINTLVKPENLYSRGLAINPKNDEELFYSSGKALYKSINAGKSWTPIQFDFDRAIESIILNPENPAIIYLGTTKLDSSSFKLFP